MRLSTHIFLSHTWFFMTTWWWNKFLRMRLMDRWSLGMHFLMNTYSGRLFLNVKISQDLIFLFKLFEFLNLVSFKFFEASIDLMDLWLLSGINILVWEYLWNTLMWRASRAHGIFLENHSTWVLIIDSAPSSYMNWFINLFTLKRFKNALFVLHHLEKLNIWNINFIEIYLLLLLSGIN